jgi:hypothetical protein
MPKGVMWRQDDLFNVLGAAATRCWASAPAATIDEPVASSGLSPDAGRLRAIQRVPADARHRPVLAPDRAEPGGCVVSLPSRHFDVVELLDEVQRNRVNS